MRFVRNEYRRVQSCGETQAADDHRGAEQSSYVKAL